MDAKPPWAFLLRVCVVCLLSALQRPTGHTIHDGELLRLLCVGQHE